MHGYPRDCASRIAQEINAIPGGELTHAVAQAIKVARSMKSDQILIVNLSGRGDKDVNSVREVLES